MSIFEGEDSLTAVEWKYINMYCDEELSVREIAERCDTTPQCVTRQLLDACDKLHLRDRQALLYWYHDRYRV